MPFIIQAYEPRGYLTKTGHSSYTTLILLGKNNKARRFDSYDEAYNCLLSNSSKEELDVDISKGLIEIKEVKD